MHRVDETGTEELADGVGSAAEADIEIHGRGVGLSVGAVDAVGDEVEHRPTVHLERRTAVVG